MHVLIWAEDSEAELKSEILETFPSAQATVEHSVMLAKGVPLARGVTLPQLAFCRQLLPDARLVKAESIRSWTEAVLESIVGVLPDHQPWLLHVAPHYGLPGGHRIGARAWHTLTRQSDKGGMSRADREPAQDRAGRPVAGSAGLNRCALIRAAIIAGLQKKRRHLLRQLRPAAEPLTPAHSIAQVLLTQPDAGFISVAPSPIPFEQRHLILPFPKGEIELASDKTAPSRAFAKLVEAELRMGRAIQAGESCVDLGASPGSWTWVAVNRGAAVVAVDRAPLREDLMANSRVRFQQGDGFRFVPAVPVDWLLCDLISAPEQTAELLVMWIRRRWCKHFIVTLKMKEIGNAERQSKGPSPLLNARLDAPAAVLRELKRQLPPLTSELFLARLCANKKEVCAFGSL